MTSLSEKAENHQIAFELLEDRYNLKDDVILNGERIVNELERIADIPIKSLDETLNSTSVAFDENFTTILDRMCFFVSSISPELKVNLGTTNPINSMSPLASKKNLRFPHEPTNNINLISNKI